MKSKKDFWNGIDKDLKKRKETGYKTASCVK